MKNEVFAEIKDKLTLVDVEGESALSSSMTLSIALFSVTYLVYL